MFIITFFIITGRKLHTLKVWHIKILLLVYKTYISIWHIITTFYGIVQTDIMIHKVINVKYFLANTWNYMSYRKQVISCMLSTEPLYKNLLWITHHKLSLYMHIHMWNIYIAFCLVLHVYMMMSKYMCKYCFFLHITR